MRDHPVGLPPLSSLDRAILRECVVKKLDELRFTAPAKIVDGLLENVQAAVRGQAKTTQGQEIELEVLEPWPGSGPKREGRLIPPATKAVCTK